MAVKDGSHRDAADYKPEKRCHSQKKAVSSMTRDGEGTLRSHMVPTTSPSHAKPNGIPAIHRHAVSHRSIVAQLGQRNM